MEKRKTMSVRYYPKVAAVRPVGLVDVRFDLPAGTTEEAARELRLAIRDSLVAALESQAAHPECAILKNWEVAVRRED